MPAVIFNPGDDCELLAFVSNDGQVAVDNVPLFVVLDIGVGSYWFWPSWRQYPPDSDFRVESFLPGDRMIQIIDLFSWPAGVGQLSGIQFLGAVTDGSITRLISNVGSWEFSYAE